MNNHVKAGFNTFDMGDFYTGVEEMIGTYIRKYNINSGIFQSNGVQVHSKLMPALDILDDIKKIDQALFREAVIVYMLMH